MHFSTLPFSLLAVLISATAFSQPLSGIKTIGGGSPDYATITAAATALNANGVGAGGVTFNIRDGDYTENFSITATGSQDNPIVFQSENQDASLVIISSSASGDVVTLTGAAYVTLNKLSIDYSGSSGYSAIELQDNSDNITISDCILDGTSSSSTAYASSVIYASETMNTMDCDNLTLTGCTLRNGSYGISFDMSTSQPTGLIISGNRFENGYAGGMYLSDLSAVEVKDNTIHTTQTGNSSCKGIYLDNCDGKNMITGNYIYTGTGGRIAYGIHLNSSASTSGNESLLANNSIQVSNTNSLAYGIYQSNNSNFYNIYNNTVYISAGTSTGNACYNGFTASGDLNIKNNIFINASTAAGSTANRSVYIANASGINELSNNCYYSTNVSGYFNGYYGTGYTSLATFIAATSETGSVSIDPQMTFVAGIGWKAGNVLLAGAGVTLAEVTTDIDNNLRQSPPSIGAHETDVTISITEQDDLGLSAYEYDRTLFIRSDKNVMATVRICDISGREVLHTSVSVTNESRLSLNALNTGIYSVTVYSKNKVFNQKILVR